MKKMTEVSRQRIGTIEQTLKECVAQDTLFKAFAFFGAYDMVWTTVKWMEANKPEETEVIEAMKALRQEYQDLQRGSQFDRSAQNFVAILKETADLKDVVSSFAYRYVYGQLEYRISWAKQFHPEDKQVYAEAVGFLKGYNKDRTQNSLSVTGPSM